MSKSPSGFPKFLLWTAVNVACGVCPIINKALDQRSALGFHLKEAAGEESGDPLSSPSCDQLVT